MSNRSKISTKNIRANNSDYKQVQLQPNLVMGDFIKL